MTPTLKIIRRLHRRGGFSLLYAILAMVVLFGLISFAVDYGRMQVVKSELQRVADAAALHAAPGLLDGSYQDRARIVAAENTVDGASFRMNNGDVTSGTWANGTFSVGGPNPNAVRIHAELTAVPMIFGRLIGISTRDVQAYSIAVLPLASYGVVGLTSISMGGNTSTSYWSPDGTANSSEHGSIASNGNITLSGSTMIYGDARPGVGGTISGGSGRVTGSTQQLAAPLSFPNANAGTYENVNDDNLVPQIDAGHDLKIGGSTTVTIPAGTYYLHDLTISPQATLICSGPVTMYVYHNVNVGGSTLTYGNLPRNLKIILCPDKNGNSPGPVSISSNSAMYASIYAPQSPVTLSGNGDLYGSVLGQSISMTGTSNIHYDLSLSGGTGVATLVK
jgi:Flp pilus assembly protein TadG